MAWCTKLKPGEEIVIGDQKVIRVQGDRVAHISIKDIGPPPRMPVIKRPVRPDER